MLYLNLYEHKCVGCCDMDIKWLAFIRTTRELCKTYFPSLLDSREKSNH